MAKKDKWFKIKKTFTYRWAGGRKWVKPSMITVSKGAKVRLGSSAYRAAKRRNAV